MSRLSHNLNLSKPENSTKHHQIHHSHHTFNIPIIRFVPRLALGVWPGLPGDANGDHMYFQ